MWGGRRPPGPGRRPARGEAGVERQAHDAIVVGGGVTGTAVARDLALRGVDVLLLEREDWGAGASACEAALETFPIRA